MGKFVYAVLTAFIIELALYLFSGTTYGTTSIFNLIMNPTSLTSAAFYVTLVFAITVFAASTIIPGNFIQINIYALYSGLAVSLISFTASIAHLWVFTHGQLTGLGGMAEADAVWIASVITAPFLMFYMLAIAEWMRSNN